MEDMGNPAGNSRLPDVLRNFDVLYNLIFQFYRPAEKAYSIYPGPVLVINAKHFNAISLDINNSIALILLYFGPTALIDGQRMHPVTMEDNSSLTSLGGQVPGVFLIWIMRIISLGFYPYAIYRKLSIEPQYTSDAQIISPIPSYLLRFLSYQTR